MSQPPRAIGAFFTVMAIFVVAARPALADHKPASSIPAEALIQAADFAASLAASTTPKPLILQVRVPQSLRAGPHSGAEYVGAAGNEDGLKGLRDRVAALPENGNVIIAVAAHGESARTSLPPTTHCSKPASRMSRSSTSPRTSEPTGSIRGSRRQPVPEMVALSDGSMRSWAAAGKLRLVHGPGRRGPGIRDPGTDGKALRLADFRDSLCCSIFGQAGVNRVWRRCPAFRPGSATIVLPDCV